MPFAKYKEYAVEYMMEGRGSALVLVHGTAQTAASSWLRILPQLKKDFQVLCPHYSGSGKTTMGKEPLTLSLLAEQVLAAADDAGLHEFDVLGHSLGTCVAMQLAAEHPDRVRRLILLGGFSNTRDTRMQMQFGMWRELARTQPGLLAELFMYSAYSPAFFKRFSEEQVRRFITYIRKNTNWEGAAMQIDLDMRIDMGPDLTRVTQPTLVVGCKQDFIVPVSHAMELAVLIPDSTYAELDAGHVGADECPEEFIGMIRNFLLPCQSGENSGSFSS